MEHEIAGHGLKIYKTARNKKLPFWHKAREIAIEILIITFAVSLAAFLERQREYSNEQKDVREFLLGLRTDLQVDQPQLHNDKKTYERSTAAFNFLIAHPGPGSILNNDSLKQMTPYLFNTTEFIPNDGRYEGFKSSGKINNIKNKELENDILTYYQENIPALKMSTGAYIRGKELLFQYIYAHLTRKKDGSNNLAEVLTTDQAQNISYSLSSTHDILARYDTLINKSARILALIDKEFKE